LLHLGEHYKAWPGVEARRCGARIVTWDASVASTSGMRGSALDDSAVGKIAARRRWTLQSSAQGTG
jgi:hypothetical protein